MNCAPQWGQTSFVRHPALLQGHLIPPCDAITLIIVLIVFIAFLLLFIAGRLVSDGCCICGPLALIAPDIQRCSPTVCFGAKQYWTYASKRD